jgi:hypothetical protein
MSVENRPNEAPAIDEQERDVYTKLFDVKKTIPVLNLELKNDENAP